MTLGEIAINDFEDLITEYGKAYTITRLTETTDSMGTVSNVTETTFTIYGLIQDISAKDRKIHEMGLAITGNRKIYTPTTNNLDGSNRTINVGDIITDQYSTYWKIVEILKQPYINDSEVFRVAIIKNITNEKST